MPELANIHHRKEWEQDDSASFLYNATRTMYERLGFSYERPKGKGNCVMTMVVPARTQRVFAPGRAGMRPTPARCS